MGDQDPTQQPQPTTEPIEPSKPVAYTANGQPLYAQPEIIVEQAPIATAALKTTKAIDPDHPGQELTPEEVQRRHDQSVADYPCIQFLPQEYVAIDVARTSFAISETGSFRPRSRLSRRPACWPSGTPTI